MYRVYGVFLALKFCQEMFPLRFGILRVSVYRKSDGNAQTSVSVTYPNHGNAEINFLEICSCFRHVS